MGADDVVTGSSVPAPHEGDVRTRGPFGLRSFPGGFVVGALVAVAVSLLIIQNGESTQLDWLAFQFETPLWIMLLLTLVAGGVIAEVGKAAVSRSRSKAKERRRSTGAKPAAKGRKS